MGNIKTNERELAQKVTQWLDAHIKRGNYPFKEATAEPSIKVDGITYFADVIIWRNRLTSEAYSYLELKPPGGKEDLERFRKKATALSVKFAITWDFQTVRVYEVKDNKVELKNTELISVLAKIEDWKRGDKQALIQTIIGKICDDLIHLHETGKPHKFIPDTVFFVNLIRTTTEKLLTVFESFIHQAQHKKVFKETIKQYARVQGIPVTEDYTKVLANHVVYGLITKIIFYLTIRRYFKDLPSLEEIEESDLSDVIRKSFSKARDKDWQAVFEEDPIEQLGIPKDAYPILYHFFSELKVYHFGELPEDVIGQLFEDIIDPEKRHSLGQYFTREDLVDLVIATCVADADGVYGDPTCGSGTFLVRLYDRLKFLSQNRGTHKERLDKIWGFDVGKFPAELSTINLFRQDVTDYENFPRVRKTDIFELKKGDTFDFPPPHSGSSSLKIQLKLPEFNSLVGNFPYIRQELIEKDSPGYKKKLTKILAEEYFRIYPALFTLKGISSSQLKTLAQIQTAVDKGWLELKLSGQADIYAYIFLHTATFLKDDGAFAIITSNSWLDVSYGAVLKRFFLDHFKVKMIIASWAEPWFEEAAVNTVVTVLEKETDATKRNENQVHFVKLKKKLSEILPFDIKFESTRRWQKLDTLVTTIEEARYHRDCKNIAEGISTLETDEMRIRVVPQAKLAHELNEKDELAKWGKYLRAPDVYFEILEKCKDKLVPLKQIADVRRGYTTGINEFFYLTPIVTLSEAKSLNKKEKKDSSSRLKSDGTQNDMRVQCRNDRGWEGKVEECYLKKVIKSPKESESIIIDPFKLKYLIFICDKSKAELKKLGHTGALNYIEWGEKQRTKENKPWTEVPSVQGRKQWWSLGRTKLPEIIIPAGIADVFKVFDNSVNILNDKRLYEIYIKGEESLKYIMNSTLHSFFIEANSRISLGDGLVDLTVYEVEENLVPRSILFSKGTKEKLAKIYQKISTKKVKPIFDEIKQKDRRRLDEAVLEILGLSPDDFLTRIYEGLCEMVRERLDLPKMRKKQQKEKVKLALDQIKKSVIEECIPDGVRRFPDAFYDVPLSKDEIERYPTSGQPLTYEHFFGQYEVKDMSNQKIFTTDSEHKAEFAKLLAKSDVYELGIPKNGKIVKKVLTAYRKYIKQLEEQLATSARQHTHDWAIAERLAKEIMEEYGIRTV